MKSIRSYQRELRRLKNLIAEIQWVQPVYNGSESCSGCGNMKHWMCEENCPVAAITGDCGEKEVTHGCS